MATPFRFKNADNTTVDFEDYYVRADYFRSGNLWVWGNNFYGQLGDNTTINRSSPVQAVTGGTNWKQVSGGLPFTATIKSDGTLWTWGRNSYGGLGDNTVVHKSSPVQTVAFGTNWKQVAAGYIHTAAIKTDGTLWCWGYNLYGQLGENTATQRNSPIQTVAFGTNWKQVSSGFYHCAAIKTDGTLWTWGYNDNGQLGDNTIVHRSSPVQTTAFGSNWKQVYCGRYNTAAIKTDGTLWCWGQNANGQLGDSTITKKSSPVQTIAFGTNWMQVFSGYQFTAAIKADGTLWTWGQNSYGGLGDNTTIKRSSPVQTVAFGTSWKQVAGGSSHIAAIKTDGTLWVWGSGLAGQLGNNTTTDKSSPVQSIMYGTNWKQVSGGNQQTAAIQYQDDYQ